MSNYKKLTAAALAAFAIAISFGSSPAAAACDGSWQMIRYGSAQSPRVWRQCYYLPTVSNGRVTGLEYNANIRTQRRYR